MRVGPDIDGRIYYRRDGGWKLSDRETVYPEGWYIVPPSFVAEGDG